ncbi:hypothetical protein KIL84_008214 [Mauremys mutica]|uniref:Uncharacterized protein n=1 Tax=Mauremys mutica TaxID=74926 RepID=A0A9D3XA77_9SAUR|nr:hypothetical protein KIL84_008214 [Mauremys mutica]
MELTEQPYSHPAPRPQLPGSRHLRWPLLFAGTISVSVINTMQKALCAFSQLFCAFGRGQARWFLYVTVPQLLLKEDECLARKGITCLAAPGRRMGQWVLCRQICLYFH